MTDHMTGPADSFGNVSPIAAQRELSLDKTLEETFPCSDPLSSIPNPMANSEDVSLSNLPGRSASQFRP